MEHNTATMLPLPELSPEVLAYAEERGVSAYLPSVREMTRKHFPHSAINVVVYDDPELRDNRQILFEVDFTEIDPPESVEAIHSWNGRLFENCPAPLVHVFCLSPYRTR